MKDFFSWRALQKISIKGKELIYFFKRNIILHLLLLHLSPAFMNQAISSKTSLDEL